MPLCVCPLDEPFLFALIPMGPSHPLISNQDLSLRALSMHLALSRHPRLFCWPSRQHLWLHGHYCLFDLSIRSEGWLLVPGCQVPSPVLADVSYVTVFLLKSVPPISRSLVSGARFFSVLLASSRFSIASFWHYACSQYPILLFNPRFFLGIAIAQRPLSCRCR